MARLSAAVKRRIVDHLACYYSPSEVSDLVFEELEVRVSARHVRAYDPGSFQFAAGSKWSEYFDVARERFHTEIASIPIASRAYRLHRTSDLHRLAVANGNLEVALKALEQAAKEVGDVYSARARSSEATGSRLSAAASMSPDERREKVADLMRTAIAQITERQIRSAPELLESAQKLTLDGCKSLKMPQPESSRTEVGRLSSTLKSTE